MSQQDASPSLLWEVLRVSVRTGNGPIESYTRACHAVACPNQEFPAFMYSPLCLLSSYGEVIELLSICIAGDGP